MFNSISLHTALILNRLRNERTLREFAEEKQKQGDRDAKRTRNDEEKKEDERRYIEERLREIRAWEKRINGDSR